MKPPPSLLVFDWPHNFARSVVCVSTVFVGMTPCLTPAYVGVLKALAGVIDKPGVQLLPAGFGGPNHFCCPPPSPLGPLDSPSCNYCGGDNHCSLGGNYLRIGHCGDNRCHLNCTSGNHSIGLINWVTLCICNND